MRYVSLAVVLLTVVLAGCASAPTGPPGATPTETPTATPIPSGDLAPGVSDAGIENLSALLSAHERGLLAEGFRLTESAQDMTDGTPSQRSIWKTVAGPGGTHATIRSGEYWGSDVPAVESDSWLNATRAITKRSEDGRTTYSVRPRSQAPEELADGSFRWMLRTDYPQYDVTEVETRNGTRYVTLEATMNAVGLNDTEDDTTSTLVVDDAGRIWSYERTTDYGNGVTWRLTYELTALGVDAPEPPAWLADVPPSAALVVDLDVGMTRDGVLLLQNYGRDPMPEGTNVTLVSTDTVYRAALDSPLPEGQRRFISIQNGTLRVTSEEPAAGSFSPLPASFSIRVTAVDGHVFYARDLGA